MSGSNTTVFETKIDLLDLSISKRAILAGATLGILVNMSALLIPVLNYVGGGVIAGFVAAYIVGGPRGWLHGIIAGIIAGLVGGTNAVLVGQLFGIIEPPSLMQDAVGIIAPQFSGMGTIGSLLIILGIAGFIVVDSIIGGMIGALLRTVVNSAFGR